MSVDVKIVLCFNIDTTIVTRVLNTTFLSPEFIVADFVALLKLK